MDDNVTILFGLSDGQTPTGPRAMWNVASFVKHEHVQAVLDPSREDLGVGPILEDPSIVAVNVAWLDDYEDSQEPVLAITGTFKVVAIGTNDAQAAVQLMGEAVPVPHFPSGVQIMEWIATYMRDNVYHDGMEASG
jgi:hypothetical protein